MQTDAVFENIAERIQTEIGKTKHTLLIAVAWFTNRNIFNAILDKAKEGCSVSLIISDDEINANSRIDFSELEKHNGRFYKFGDGEAELMHNKFCVIDNSTVITGSYNWSYKAGNNFENIVINYNARILAEQFIVEFYSLIKKLNPKNYQKGKQLPADAFIKRHQLLKNDPVLIPYRKKDKWGFCTPDKKIVIDCKYDYAQRFSEGLVGVELNGKQGFIDNSGNIVIPLIYDGVSEFYEGIARVELNEKWGFIDKYKKIILPIDYDIQNEGKELRSVSRYKFNGKLIYYNKSTSYGYSLIGFPFPLNEGMARIFKNEKYGFVDKNCRLIIPLIYDYAIPYSEGLAAVKLNGKWGFIDRLGKVIIPLSYEHAYSFSDGLAGVMKGGQGEFIDRYGKTIISVKQGTSLGFTFFSEGVAKSDFGIEGHGAKYGFINKTGNADIPPRYYYAYSFSEGLAGVDIHGGAYGFIDKNGKEVIPSNYQSVDYFSEGLAGVANNRFNWGFIDKTGQIVIPLKYSDVEIFNDGLARVTVKESKYQKGYINKSGTEFWED